MPASPAQIDANRRNARKSTGPKTQAGKDRSRMNALKHGLCSEVVRVPEDQEMVDSRARAWLHALKPQNAYHAWLLEEVAVLTFRVDRCARIERRARDVHSLKAEGSWDDDRRLEVEAIGRGLAADPAFVVKQLRTTPHGCDWLQGRWALLARAADRSQGTWTADQASLAFDLLGTPAPFRDGDPGEVIDGRGRVTANETDLAAFARRQIDALMAHREEVADSDDLARRMAEADLVDLPTDEVRKIRRYESALYRRLRWCISQIEAESPRLRANSDLVLNRFAEEAEGEATSSSTPELPETPNAPFDLEPHEVPPIGVEPDFPAILSASEERKLRKSEARREGRRRTVERILSGIHSKN